MTSMNFRRTLVGAAVATALGVLADPATAAPYRGAFDPVDFAGEYIINVNPTCLAHERLACKRRDLRRDAAQRLRGCRFLGSGRS